MNKSIIILLSLTLFSQVLWADDIVITADPWCPYLCEPESDMPGFMVEIAQQVFKKAGHNLIYKHEPWARALRNSRMGTNNGSIGAYKSDAPDHIFTAEELGVSTTLFFIKKGTAWRYNSTVSLEKITIGVIRGYSYGGELDAYVKKHQKNWKKVQISDSLHSLVKKLLAGRIDTFPDDRMVVNWYVKKNNLSGKLQEAGLAVDSEKLYIAFSPKLKSSQKYAEILSNGIGEFRKNGQLSKILSRYGLEDWK